MALRSCSRAAQAAVRAAGGRAKSTAPQYAGAAQSMPVNAWHEPDTLQAPQLVPVSNETPPVSESHWDDTWDAAALRAAVEDNVMATWGPTASMKGVPHIVKAEGVHLWDAAGNKYIDWTSQAVCMNLGHTIPATVKAAIDDQLSTAPFLYGGLAMSEPRARLSALMAELAPADINGFLFPSGGAEANEAAIRTARRYTGRHKVINHYRSYHGGTASTLGATGDFRRWFAEAGTTGFVKAFNPAPIHFSLGASEDEVAQTALAMLEEQILMEGPETIAAVMMESVIGAGGVFILPQSYVQGVRALCDKYGMLMILDEVMTGFGRTGKFWGMQHYEGVVPDIMTSAKGLSGSYLPLSVVGVRQHIKDRFESESIGWGSTYQAHPVALRCAYESVKYMIKERVVENVQKLEPVLLEGIQTLIDDHPSVKQGRGIGLFGCIDTVNAEGKLTQKLQGPMTDRNAQFRKALADNGVYGLLRLPHMHAAPPLIINEEDLRDGFERIGRALDQTLDKEFS